jgi:hypothetical protein
MLLAEPANKDIDLFGDDVIPNLEQFKSKWERKNEKKRRKIRMLEVLEKYEWAKEFCELARKDVYHPMKSRSLNEKIKPHIEALYDQLSQRKNRLIP